MIAITIHASGCAARATPTASAVAQLPETRHITGLALAAVRGMAKAWAGFQSILCPVDFSAPSRRALRFAAAIARHDGASLEVLYVNDPLLVASASAALHDRHLVERSGRELKAFVDATIPGVAARRRATSQAVIGDPVDQILKQAKRQRADLIVVGTQGLTGAARLLIGSTTQKILQRATVPVLAIPKAARFK